MKRLLVLALFAVVVMAVLVLAQPSPVQAAGCSCRGSYPVCCYNCDETIAYCARSHAFCPECAAP